MQTRFSREIDELPSRVLGRRREADLDWDEIDQLLRTAWELRGKGGIARRGLFRFTSFEEAEQWMIREMVRTSRSGRRRSKTSPGSPPPSKPRAPAIS